MTTLKATLPAIALALLIPLIAYALYPLEHWVTIYLFQRGEIGDIGYCALRFAEMILFALATFVLMREVIAPKRWSIVCLGVGFLTSALLLTQVASVPFFTDFDILRAFLTTAYGVSFLLALSGKVSA